MALSAFDLTKDDQDVIPKEQGGLTFNYDKSSLPYKSLIEAAETQHGLPKNVLPRLIYEESRFDPKAKSPKGAEGIAQIMRSQHPLVKNPYDPNEAIPYSASYLKQLYNKFGDWSKAIAAYNTGPGNVAAGTIPPETTDYTKRIYGQAPESFIKGVTSAFDLGGVAPTVKIQPTKIVQSQPQKLLQAPPPPGGYDEAGQPLAANGVPYAITGPSGAGISNASMIFPISIRSAADIYQQKRQNKLISPINPKGEALSTAPATNERLQANVPQSWWQWMKAWVQSPSMGSSDKAAIVGGLQRQTGMSTRDIIKNYDEMTEQIIARQVPTVKQVGERALQAGIIAGIATHPIYTAAVVLKFMGMDEGINWAVSKAQSEPYKFQGGQGFSDLLGAQGFSKDAIDMMQMFAVGLMAGGRGPKSIPSTWKEMRGYPGPHPPIPGAPWMTDLSLPERGIIGKYISSFKDKVVATNELAAQSKATGVDPTIIAAKGLKEQLIKEDLTSQGEKVKEIKGTRTVDVERAKAKLEEMKFNQTALEAGEAQMRMNKEIVRKNAAETKAAEKVAKSAFDLTAEEPKVDLSAPDLEFTSKKGNRYVKVGETWYTDTGKEVKNQIKIGAFEKGGKAPERIAPDEGTKIAEEAAAADKEAFEREVGVDLTEENVVKYLKDKGYSDEDALSIAKSDLESRDMLTFDKEGERAPVTTMTEYDKQFKEFEAEGTEEIPRREEPYTNIDEQTGEPVPQQLLDDSSPFRNTDKEATAAMSKAFGEKMNTVRQNPEMLTQYFLNEVNRYLNGEEGIDIARARDSLSELAARADEAKLAFDTDADFQMWRDLVPEAATWARRADRAKFERTDIGTRLNVMIPLDQIPKTVRDVVERIKGIPIKGVPVGELYRNYRIFKDTGFWLGRDERWRYEISDTGLVLHTNKISGKEQSLSSVVDYPRLFEAVPNLKATTVKTDYTQGLAGTYSPATDTISLKTGIDRETLAHEIQHAVNYKLGSEFTGTNIKRESIRGQLQEIVNRLDSIIGLAKTDEIRNLAKENSESLKSKLANDQLPFGYVEWFVSEMLPKVKETEDPNLYWRVSSETNVDATKSYLSNPGEMEARVSANRLNLTQPERNAKPPWETLDSMLGYEGVTHGYGSDFANVGQKLYSGLPMDEMLKTMQKAGRAFSDKVDELRGMKDIDIKATAKRMKKGFTEAFVEKSGNIRQDFIDKLGDRGYKVVELMYLQNGAHPKAINMLNQMRKEVYRGAPKYVKDIIDKLALAERIIDISKYKTSKQFTPPENMTLENAIIFKELFRYKEYNGVRNLTNGEAFDILHTNSDGSIGGRVGAYFDWMRKPIKDALDEGLITQKEHDDLISHNYRRLGTIEDVFDRVSQAKLGGRKLSVNDSGIQRLQKGKATDIYEASAEIMALESFNRLYGRIFKNRADRDLLDLARTNRENPFARVKESKDDPKIPEEFRVNSIKVYENGKPINLFLSPEMAKEWVTSNAQITYRYAQTIKWLTGAPLVRTFATGINWAFALRNLPRDIMQIWFTARTFKNGKYESVYNPVMPIAAIEMTIDMARVIRDAILRKGRYNDYIDDGGGMDLLTTQGRMFQKGKHLESGVDKAYDFLGYAGTTSETMTRLMVRETVIRKEARSRGISYEEAAKDKGVRRMATFAARDYMDFHQGGTISKALDVGLPYFNARIVATRGIIRALLKDQPLTTMFKVAQFGGLVSALYIGNQHLHPETMEALKGDQRTQGNFVFPVGDKFAFEDSKGQTRYPFFVIPVDQSMTFFKTLFEAGADLWLGNPVDIKRATMSFGATSPVDLTPLPPTLSGALGYRYNKDFWQGRDIRPQGKLFGWKLPKLYTGAPLGGSEEEYDANTPQALIDTGKVTGLSPERLKYMAGQLITNDNMFASLLGKGYDSVLGQLPKEEREMCLAEILSKIPIVKSFFKLTDPNARYNQVINESEEISEVKRFTQNRGLKTRVDGFLYDDNYDKADILEYMKSFDDRDAYDRMKKSFDFQVKTRDLPNRNFWIRLEGLGAEARARAYIEEIDNASPNHLADLQSQQAQVHKAGGFFTDEFRHEVKKYRQQKDY